ncbi:FG-GAP-like repeat-containing protein [Roseiconus lacunae]|uniref:FG-GAP-like repeat-containing protein n=1 Tax=Roseiconus lacunae TaxID=2605694 RepID=A0ABT7PP76_9BACT|nr:FG-GAP-like repeat-containing protein [Roseiconus lacunae]MDM4018287.1 FG-GAP-like repeat-containing protein [Roseiconus lacunae]
MNVFKALLILRQRREFVLSLLAIVAFALIPSGCDKNGPDAGGQNQGQTGVGPKYVNPEGSLKIASRNRNWTEAFAAAEYLADQSRADQTGLGELTPEVLVLMARAAHEVGQSDTSTQWLMAACENESYRSATRVRQAMIAMIGVGRFHEGLAMLEAAVKANPDQHETRRWLFDFYIGAEDRVAALKHGRYLVRHRKIDVELLQSISNTERRFLDPTPLAEMMERNPEDKRPLMGGAKQAFDQSRFEETVKTLREITAAHPDYLPAQALLGQSLSAAGRINELRQWAASQPAGIEDYPGYWIALGDWSRANNDQDGALRAFAEAAISQDPDVVQVWTRLATLLAAARNELSDVDDEVVEAVNGRAQMLGRLQQLKDRFTRTGGISRSIVIDLAKTLEQLGRLWEAEAWASIATTLPEDESVDVDGYRMSLVRRLRQETPWQLPSEFPPMSQLAQNRPLPAIESVVSAKSTRIVPSSDDKTDTNLSQHDSPWRLDDEAEQRGLRFWGRTADTLDQPGIMLYQTLGCGGGTIDFDLDGNSDLYLVTAGGTPPASDSKPNELFRNLDGQFVPAGTTSLSNDRGFGQGVAVGDVNEDGFADLLILNYGPNRMLINQGDGTFIDANDRLPQEPNDEWSSSAAIADLDHDGISDIIVVNYCATLDPVTKSCSVDGTEMVRSCSPVMFAAQPDRFLQNDGTGRFVNATEQWEATSNDPGRGLGIVVGDLDGSVGNEVFIANDMTANHYWSSVSQASPSKTEDVSDFALRESAMLRGLGGDDRGIPMGSMGIATADLDRDGDLDLYVTNFSKETNTLHMQTAGGVWQDRTSAAGLVEDTRPLVAFGTEAIDLENDGSLELVVTNGHVDLFSRGSEKAMYDQPAQIFQRGESGRYSNGARDSIGQYFAKTHVGRGLWTIDVNRDGLLDFVVTHQTEPTALIVNQGSSDHDWVRLILKGTRSSRDAIGATVKIKAGETVFTAFRLAGDGYQCSNDPAIHVGLGQLDQTEVEVEIVWPDGTVESYPGIPAGTETVLVQHPEEPVQ